ncbi:glycosyltransferase family 2 protein [Pleurocapsales cyanobacterium LEGE 10410]|nr:glycosyltransferase family 2 protein [Pleurocapsales cyanobacterium LEGE 10410]
MQTPVALLIFNRPDTTERVFAAIRQAQPSKLLVVADGARSDRPGEAEKCQATRAIIDCVDWKCEVLTNYSEVNLGCKVRVSSGLDWVFEQVESAIILEDDCLPHPSFFLFCDTLLDYYRDDERIMAISGNNFQLGRKRTDYSYYFSRYNHCWGWATWRRAWQHYDLEMKLWQEIRDGNWLESILETPQAVKYWHRVFQAARDRQVDTWDYQWTFACWLQNGLTVLPNVNLVTNIGFGSEASNTIDSTSKYANLPTHKMCFPLTHPPFMLRHIRADSFTQKTYFNRSIRKRVVNKTKKIFTSGFTK